MNAVKAFVDTNVFLYLYASSDRTKFARARNLLHELRDGNRVLLSTQVVQEFYVNARRLQVAGSELSEAVSMLLALPLVVVGEAEIQAAITHEKRYQITFWDALIVSSAESGGAGLLYTEDLNDGQQYGTVMVCNPFAS
jgi:predicted nucleic acid-binding protein